MVCEKHLKADFGAILTSIWAMFPALGHLGVGGPGEVEGNGGMLDERALESPHSGVAALDTDRSSA